MNDNEMRLFSFVAHHYLSQLQQGLQTGHAISEIRNAFNTHRFFDDWSRIDKTIIIYGVSNHRGVEDAFIRLRNFSERRYESPTTFPHAIFHEDEDSMNGMATACAIVLPAKIWGARKEKMGAILEEQWVFFDGHRYYFLNALEIEIVEYLKEQRLA